MLTNRQLFLNHIAQTTNFPMALEVERVEGVMMYGKNGENYSVITVTEPSTWGRKKGVQL